MGPRVEWRLRLVRRGFGRDANEKWPREQKLFFSPSSPPHGHSPRSALAHMPFTRIRSFNAFRCSSVLLPCGESTDGVVPPRQRRRRSHWGCVFSPHPTGGRQTASVLWGGGVLYFIKNRARTSHVFGVTFGHRRRAVSLIRFDAYRPSSIKYYSIFSPQLLYARQARSA